MWPVRLSDGSFGDDDSSKAYSTAVALLMAGGHFYAWGSVPRYMDGLL